MDNQTSGHNAPAPDRIREIGFAFRASKVLMSAIELGVFGVLADGPLSMAALRTTVGVAERGARDFFDTLVSLGLLERDDDGLYRNTPECDRYLDPRKSTFIGGELLHAGQRIYPLWQRLTDALKTGAPQDGLDTAAFYPSLYSEPGMPEIFSNAMTAGSLLAARAMATLFPWRNYTSVVDVGTAQGCLPVEIARAHPHLVVGGFDLPQLRQPFESYVRKNDLARRIQYQAGDFLSEPLPPADVIVLGRVLHNWDLRTKKMLLRNAYDAVPSNGCVIIYERFIDDERRRHSAALLASLNMLIMTEAGFDFTTAECMAWMKDAGFGAMSVQPLAGGISMVVGNKS